MPANARPWIVAIVTAYLVAVLAIGVLSARRTRTARDFFIAGQRIGLVVTALATMAAAFSGFIFLGGPGLTYRMGLSSLWIVLPVGFTSGMLCWALGGRLRAIAGRREVFTVTDAVAWRFPGRAPSALSALAVLAGTLGYLGLQLQAAGILLREILGTQGLLGAMLIGLAVLTLYSVIGGMVAGVYTDVLQGAMMLVVAVSIFAVALESCGGWGEMTRAVAASESFGREFLEPLGRTSPFTAFGFFFVFGIGVLGQPQMLHKFYMLDDPRKMRWMPLVLGSSQAVCLLVWLGIGLAVPALVAAGRIVPLLEPDRATPTFLFGFTPPWLAGLAVAGILAAIMSTADSFLNIGSAALVRDLPRAFGFRLGDELLWGRIAVPLIGLAAALFALGYGDLIALLGTFAFGTFAAALAPALTVGLNWRRVTPAAAAASIGTGLVLNLGLELLDKQRVWPTLPGPPLAEGVLPSAFALAASFTVLFFVTWWGRREATVPLPAEVREVIDGDDSPHPLRSGRS